MDFLSAQIGSDIDDDEHKESVTEAYSNSRHLEWSFLRRECKNLGLEEFYKSYMQRLQRSYLSVYYVLQTVITIGHILTLVSSNYFEESETPDLFFYSFSVLIIWIVLFPAFKEDLVRDKPWLPYVCSFIAIIVLLLSDIAVPIYHDINSSPDLPLRPMYASQLLLITYMFLPIRSNWFVVLMGTIISISYLIVYSTISFKYAEDRTNKFISEVFFFTCMNFIGIHFRIMNEIDIRRALLDRRECVQENLHLKFERNQEKALLQSILPKHIAEKMENDFQFMIKKLKSEKRRTTYHILNPHSLGALYDEQPAKRHVSTLNKLYIETHDNVSVLYADIVNFTHMTTKLSVRSLVETLHELFVKFDEASEEFNVLRIKFLGDCYYCVSGLPVKNKHHAKNCVELGLRMISDIRTVRHARNLNIDMRIGVHSGRVIGGVMGALKWQYDVWSTDVMIANKLEQTGVAGQVHITKQTLDLIGRNYIVSEGTEAARMDNFLNENKIQTFLISPNKDDDEDEEMDEDCESADKVSFTLRKAPKRNFMQNSMEQFREIMQQTNAEMENELKKMPIGKFRFNKLFTPKEKKALGSKLSPLLLRFENCKMEWSFQQEPDILLKYSVLMSFLVLLTVIGIQLLNRSTSGLVDWVISLSGTVLFSIIPIVWFKKIWDMYRSSENLSKFKPLRVLYKISDKITSNVIFRNFIYLLVVILLFICSLIHLVECHKKYPKDELLKCNSSEEARLLLQEFYMDYEEKNCLNSWSVTQCLVLVICASFLFLRIHFLLKLAITSLVNILYYFIIFKWVDFIFETSPSTNIALDSKIAHFMKTVVTTTIFHLIDRQTEYIQRVDFNWKQQLEARKDEAEVTRVTNKILVHNILPVHVAEVYLSRRLCNEFYSEDYENVAVCFATIKNFETSNENQQMMLKFLNEIICSFDETLINFNGQKIEKIKVIGCTYMVACGLSPGRSDSGSSTNGLQDGRRSFNMSIYTNTLNKRYRKRHKTSVRQSNNVVLVLAEFSLELMRVLRNFNSQRKNPLKLSVGISYGSVMAGVVGSSKPLYDIWGNTVNMASRLDTTNIPGKIQVTEESANILTSFGYVCEFRGKTFIKGRGQIPTYFVSTDENLNFLKNTNVTQENNYFVTEL